MPMINNMISFYRSLSMRYKMFIQYLLLISIPIVSFFFVNQYLSADDMEKQSWDTMRQIFEEGRSYMEFKIENVNTYMTIVSLNDTVQDILKKDPSEYSDHYGVWAFDLDTIRKQFYNSRPTSDITHTSIYVDGSVTELSETTDFLRLSPVTNTIWYKNLEQSGSSYEWISLDDHTVTAVRKIPNKDSLQDQIGILRVDMNKTTFVTTLDHMASSFPNSTAFLINPKSNLLAYSSDARLGHSVLLADIIRKYSIDELDAGIWSKFRLDQTDYLIGIQSVEGISQYLAILIPYGEILALHSKAARQMLFITLIILPLTLPLAFIGASSATKRIRKLMSQMKHVQMGNFSIKLDPEGNDEISQLTHNFNITLSKISELMEEKYQLGQELKSLELNALQAQINPHFLYNTLDLMYWKATRAKETEISELVQSLSKFYKLSLSKGVSIVPLKNEIEHVKAYVSIQNARFQNGITLIINVPESLYEYKLPKITLQPLIENAIIHGILETEEETGTITITSYITNNQLILEVKDDGVGIPPDKLKQILHDNKEESANGFGVINIHRRIKLHYGETYGLSYEDHVDTGTTVKIILPVPHDGIGSD